MNRLFALATVAGVVLPAGLSPLGVTLTALTGPHDQVWSMHALLTGQTDNLGLLATTPLDGFQFPDLTSLGSEPVDSVSDPDFISNIHDLGILTLTSAADPDDDYVAFAIQTPLFTDILTSGADPEGTLGLGDASIGLAGATVNTFESSVFPFLDSSFTLPFPDPFADLFTLLVQLGL
ncbi:hypothetical protein [Mycolicibacter sinensis]|uniref:Uncharacterized protein n=1 Tax=Mycolicibacter sinensis (strain JDM601) TaxID=875328 RepID=A0A1A2ELX2_MYCSD|nr:hypothetical protein [Mycolicibacter sinensis]OBG01547.1 hypothetical protein A5772_09360 [Mycolicibacter sinensis]OBG05549.1 hypothetical protein A5771_09940 [Mycolicibacter sinensis]